MSSNLGYHSANSSIATAALFLPKKEIVKTGEVELNDLSNAKSAQLA